MRSPAPWVAVLALCAAACSPTFNWREFVPEGSGVRASFPCRPDRHARTVRVDGGAVQMDMLVCEAGGTTFALAFLDVSDPTRVGAVLAELRASVVRNVQGTPPQVTALTIPGMTPNDQAARLTVTGRLPDGARVREHVAFFTRGLRVYQATVIGAEPVQQVVDTFLGGLSFPA